MRVNLISSPFGERRRRRERDGPIRTNELPIHLCRLKGTARFALRQSFSLDRALGRRALFPSLAGCSRNRSVVAAKVNPSGIDPEAIPPGVSRRATLP